MDKKQYNNVIDWTLKHEAQAQSEDSLQVTRAICNELGVALPQGDLAQVAEVLATDDYMGWKACTQEEAQEAANNGIPAIGISNDQIVVLAAEDKEQPVANAVAVNLLDNMKCYEYHSLSTTIIPEPLPTPLPNLIDYAIGELGNNSEKYTEWYGEGANASTPWCAIFVSWCANECDFIARGVMQKFQSCTYAVDTWFKPRGLFKTRESYTPKKGDLIFFNWEGRPWGSPWNEPPASEPFSKTKYNDHNIFNHVGIVEKVENGKVHTIEGNRGEPNDQTIVGRYSFDLTNSCIRGYCVPQYDKYWE